MVVTRRRILSATGSVAAFGAAGCLGSSPPDDGASASSTDEASTASNESDGAEQADHEGPPTVETTRYRGHDLETIRDNVMSGGVRQDGIPAIDEPAFAAAGDVAIPGGEPVFGLVRNGVAKAYPQFVLVWHEIVNDVIGDEPVAVTYCPLTGTAQGFERGSVEFGVSGRLVNSNLVMYDRETESWWSQILATGIDGPLEGEGPREFRVVWTTWGRWRDAHPDTLVLTDETGHARRYGSDPYGSYNPQSGYYAQDDLLFPPLVDDPRERSKTVVIGTRTSDAAIAFNKRALLEQDVLAGNAAGTEYVAVADPALETGYIYANDDEHDVTTGTDGYRIDGDEYPAHELPLDRSLAFDAMWFAWAGFYPDTSYVA